MFCRTLPTSLSKTTTNKIFPFYNCTLTLLNLLYYFATSICNYVIQIVISTGILSFLHRYIPVFVKKKTNISIILTNLTEKQSDCLKNECAAEEYL